MQNFSSFYPTVWEVQQAKKTFLQAFQRYSVGNGKNVAIECSLATVWEAARRYQAQLEAEKQKTNVQTLSEVAV